MFGAGTARSAPPRNRTDSAATAQHWVVDVELNAAVGFTLFAGGSPDPHLFRLVDGKIRYVHTLTQRTG